MRYSIEIEKKEPVKPIVGRKGPEIGDTKKVIKFAWLPTKITKTEGVWLERYVEVMIYKKTFIVHPINVNSPLINKSIVEDRTVYFNGWCLKEKTFML